MSALVITGHFALQKSCLPKQTEQGFQVAVLRFDRLFPVVLHSIWTRQGAISVARVGNAPDGATRIIGD
jgi:hypothetical protein